MNNRTNILNKIRGLMSKTVENGCTEAEEMSALSMANTMMEANDITEEDLRVVREDESAIIDYSSAKDTHKIGWKLAYYISKFTETYCYGNRAKIKYVGIKSDVEFALFLHEHLIQFVRNQLKDYMWSNGLTSLQGAERHRVVNSFVIGCCSRINTKLNNLIHARKASVNSKALVIAKDALIKDAIKDENIGQHDNRGRKNKIDPESFKKGQTAGDKASFGRPIDGKSGILRIGKD